MKTTGLSSFAATDANINNADAVLEDQHPNVPSPSADMEADVETGEEEEDIKPPELNVAERNFSVLPFAAKTVPLLLSNVLVHHYKSRDEAALLQAETATLL